MTADELKAWLKDAGLTLDSGAVALQIGRRSLASYTSGKKPVPAKVAQAVAAIRAREAEEGALPLPAPAPAKGRKAKAARPAAKAEGAGLHFGTMRKPSPALLAFMRPLGWEITRVEILPPASGHGESSMRLHGRKLPHWKPPSGKYAAGEFQPLAGPIKRARYSKTLQAS